MLLYMSPGSPEEPMEMDPEEMKKGMEPWMEWFKKFGEAIVDQGTPLGRGINYTKTQSSKGESHVAGYSIVQADDMEGVRKMIIDHPHFMMDDTSIEALEMLPMQ